MCTADAQHQEGVRARWWLLTPHRPAELEAWVLGAEGAGRLEDGGES